MHSMLMQIESINQMSTEVQYQEQAGVDANATMYTPDVNITSFDYDDPFTNVYYYEDIDKLSMPWVHEPHFIPQVVIYGLVFLFGIFGNSTVIFSVVGGRTSRSVTFTFMISLAIADILFLMVVVPHETLRMVLGEWPGGRAFCKLSGFIEMLTASASILNLTAVSFERYFVIVMPIQSRRKCTLGNTRKVLVFVWILSVCLSAPAFYVRDTENTTYFNNSTSITLMFCADHGIPDDHRIYYAVYQFLVMFIIPTIMMVYCYTVVINVLWISGRTLVNLTSNQTYKGMALRDSDGSSGSSATSTPTHYRSRKLTVQQTNAKNNVRESIMKGRKQVIKMLITVILVFLVCWGPKLIFTILKYSAYSVHMHNQFHFKLQIALFCLPYIQSCLNPVIYGFMSKNFRKSVVTSCTTRLMRTPCRGRKQRLDEYEMESKYSNGTMQTKAVRNSASSE